MDANGCAGDRSDVQRPGHDILFGAVWISYLNPEHERCELFLVRSISTFWKKIPDGRIAITHRGPRDVADGRWSEGEFDATGAAVEAQASSPPSWSPRPWGRGD